MSTIFLLHLVGNKKGWGSERQVNFKIIYLEPQGILYKFFVI